MKQFKKQEKQYRPLDVRLSKGLCSLSDLARIGGRFLPSGIVMEERTCYLMEGELFLSGKTYPAISKLYQDGRPPVLFDILGNDATDAKQNLHEVMRIYYNARSFNVNGLGDLAKSRLLSRVMYGLTSIVTLGSAYICGLCFFSSDAMDWAYIIALVISMICFGTARVYYHLHMDELSMIRRR